MLFAYSELVKELNSRFEMTSFIGEVIPGDFASAIVDYPRSRQGKTWFSYSDVLRRTIDGEYSWCLDLYSEIGTGSVCLSIV